MWQGRRGGDWSPFDAAQDQEQDRGCQGREARRQRQETRGRRQDVDRSLCDAA